jgi:hypothetical protein
MSRRVTTITLHAHYVSVKQQKKPENDNQSIKLPECSLLFIDQIFQQTSQPHIISSWFREREQNQYTHQKFKTVMSMN